MKDISFDLETLSTASDALILSIGAVKFDRNTGEIGETFYRVIDIEDPLGGGTISASTVAWWMRQSQEARDAVFGPDVERVNLRQALAEFGDFLGFNDLPEGKKFVDAILWQRGDKDATWLTSAFEGMQLAVPFAYWNVKDQRTLCDLFKPFLPARDNVYHNAYDDALYQAQCLVAAFARLTASGALLSSVVQASVDAGLILADAPIYHSGQPESLFEQRNKVE